MLHIFSLCFFGVLILIIYYDFKYRTLPLYTLVIAVIFGILVSIYRNGLSVTLYYAGVNTLLISFQLGITTLYFSARRRKLINIFNSYLGIGDVIFFLVVIFSFSPLNFIIFIIFSELLTLVFYALPKNRKLIPLAGCLSVVLCIILFFSAVFEIVQPYNDFFLADIFWN